MSRPNEGSRGSGRFRSAPSYIARVARESAHEWPQGDQLRPVIAIFSLSVAILAAVADPASGANTALAAVPVAGFALRAASSRVPLTAVALAVIAPVVAAQRDGRLEPLFFEVSLLAFVVARWSRSRAESVLLGVACLLSPLVVALVQAPSQIASEIWMLGIAFPWGIGWALARQTELSAELDATRKELARQALLSERRRIARDVHDLVGHGLAAMMLQITSARHVLRRDPAAAEEALCSAEQAGRRGMEELRRTVSLLRSDEEAEVRTPLPSATEVGVLVDEVRAAGLTVELRTRGDLSRVPPAIGIAIYRIAQEALANAARHAPRARTVLLLELTDDHVQLATTSNGAPARRPDPDRPHYGIVGMRERAVSLGGELEARPAEDGWLVSCRIPLETGDEA